MVGDVDALAALMFALIVVIGSNLDLRGRHEWMTAMAFSAIGFWLAIAAAGDAYAALPSTYEMESGQLVSTMNLERQATAYVFFAYWTMFTAAGLLAGVLARGTLNRPARKDGFPSSGKPAATTVPPPLMVAQVFGSSPLRGRCGTSTASRPSTNSVSPPKRDTTATSATGAPS